MIPGFRVFRRIPKLNRISSTLKWCSQTKYFLDSSQGLKLPPAPFLSYNEIMFVHLLLSVLSFGNLDKLMPVLTLSITFSVKSTFIFCYVTIITKTSRTVFFLDVFYQSSFCKILQTSCHSCFILSKQKNYDKFSCLVFAKIGGALFKFYLLRSFVED